VEDVLLWGRAIVASEISLSCYDGLILHVCQIPPIMTRRKLLRSFVSAAGVACILLQASARAAERGAWFWYQSSDPNGASNVVGNATKEDKALIFFQQWGIKRLYGSYTALPTTDPTTVAAWNKKLSLAGIQSYVVMSEPTHALPSGYANLQNLVSTRFVNFNNSRSDPLERFVGIELDLEPHTLPQWTSGNNADRRTMLLDLGGAFAATRQQMTSGGYGSALLSAALPVWFDSSSSIGWNSSADRDQWFTDIGTSLDAVSLMAYETSSVSSIMNSVAYEQIQFTGDVHIALRSKLGDEWATFGDFTGAIATVESQGGAGIDIENYYRLRQTAPSPLSAGDYNNDGAVDAADYIVWRNGGPLQNDPIPGATADDYAVWRARFGANTTSGSGAARGVPEPSAWSFVLLALLKRMNWRRR